MSDKEDQASSDEHTWESGWDDHEQKQLRRMANLSLEQKLVWLEEAHRLVRNMQKKSSSVSGTSTRTRPGAPGRG
jgi:hypothetical protein